MGGRRDPGQLTVQASTMLAREVEYSIFQNARGETPIRRPAPFFRPRKAFRKSRFLSACRALGSRRLLRIIESSVLPQTRGVRRQTLWQRPPFGALLLVDIFPYVTWLRFPAMHIFSSLVQFGQLCSAECKSAAGSTSTRARSVFHLSPEWRKNRRLFLSNGGHR